MPHSAPLNTLLAPPNPHTYTQHDQTMSNGGSQTDTSFGHAAWPGI